MLAQLKSLVLATAALLSLATAALAERPQKLIIGLLPGESALTVMRLNEPLRAYLGPVTYLLRARVA